ncbi:hypothetical protein MATL_G00220880 [Megalops atlanticus]|uniref:Ig-like domain-containing protein n=1 Tax=Megalops atlanticus TaxID=7932 RepID=A0A9D3SYI5_MEGAT|nr:hypothetical protein MATL_G00220880 [Megalops atlanticus]
MLCVEAGAAAEQASLQVLTWREEQKEANGKRVSAVKELRSTVGGSVTLPDRVKEMGYISKNGTLIAKVMKSVMYNFSGSLRDRVQWDSSTGLFSIIDLKTDDSGEYKVENTNGQKSVSVYQLTVYNPVSTPQVSSSNIRFTCIVLCSVENGREVTLSWQRGGDTVQQHS